MELKKDKYEIGDIVSICVLHPVGSTEYVFSKIGVITAVDCGDYEVDCEYWFATNEIRLATDREIKNEFIKMKKKGWR